MADRGGIQLLPGTQKRVEITTPGENRLLTGGIIAIVIILATFVGLKMYAQVLTTRLAGLDQQLLDVEQGRDKTAEQQLLTYNQQATLMESLLKNHIFWSQAFSRLERVLQGQVHLTTFSGSTAKQSITFSGSAASYSVIARQIASFLADDSVQDVQVKGIKASNVGSLDFGMDVLFKKDKFLK